MKLIFLQNSATQPRCHKRFRSFVAAGCRNTEVYSFNRNWYNVNLPDDITIHSLGELRPGSYLNRLLLYIKKLRPIFKQNRDAVFYCYGQDMAFVASLFGKKYVYEESDIMYLEYKSQFMRNMMKKLDLFIQRRALASILTSQGFVDYLYGNKVPDNVFVLPNKLDGYFSDKERPQRKVYDMGALKFAFIGLLRYEKMISAFIHVMVEKNPKHEFHIWGDGGENQKRWVKEICDNYPQVHYHGPFRNPLDLHSIYAQVDINFVCYDTNGGNERIAEPNKLYESTFFNTPIMVSPNTYLSKVVRERGTGFVVDCHSEEDIHQFFEDLTLERLNEKVAACESIRQDQIIDSVDQVKKILDFIS